MGSKGGPAQGSHQSASHHRDVPREWRRWQRDERHIEVRYGHRGSLADMVAFLHNEQATTILISDEVNDMADPHLHLIRDVTPSAKGCEDCLRSGSHWVHLRLCLTCGHVGCCDSSPNRHATKHFHSTEHPIIQSFEPGEDWRWCYIDQAEV